MNGKNKTNKILIGIIICLIAVIIGGAIYFTRGTDKDKENKTPDSAFEPNLDSNAKARLPQMTGTMKKLINWKESGFRDIHQLQFRQIQQT